jgi:hypothetical protein
MEDEMSVVFSTRVRDENWIHNVNKTPEGKTGYDFGELGST